MQANKNPFPVIEVISSNKLSDKQKAEIEKKSSELFGVDKAVYQYSQDDSLIGGFVVKFGSRVADLSVSRRLNCL